MKFYKLEVAKNEALECSYKFGGVWCVIAYKYDYGIEKLSNIRKCDNIVYQTGDMQNQ